MRKIKSLFLVVLAISLVLTGCMSGNSPQDIAKEYKTKLYSVPDHTVYEKYKNDQDYMLKLNKEIKDSYEKYFSEDRFQEFIGSRRPYMYYEAAYNGKFNIELDNITFKKESEDDKVAAYNYNATIKLTHDDGTTENVVETGQVVLKKENDAWKIFADHITENPFIKYLGWPPME